MVNLEHLDNILTAGIYIVLREYLMTFKSVLREMSMTVLAFDMSLISCNGGG